MALASAIMATYTCWYCRKCWTQEEIGNCLFLKGDPQPTISAEELAKWMGSSAGMVSAGLALPARMSGKMAAFEQSLFGAISQGIVSSGPLVPTPLWESDPPAPSPPQIPDGSVPVLDGSVIGYRAWKFDSQWRLVGTGYGARLDGWVPGTNVAQCPHGHYAPAENCHCGFNALARFSNDHAWWQVAVGPGSGDIAGAIEAWSDDPEQPGETGALVVDPPGFRARYAKIILLAIDPDWPRPKQMAVRGVAADYGADICQIEHLADAAAEHGQLISDEMLGWAATNEPVSIGATFSASVSTFSSQMKAMQEALATLGVANSQWGQGLKQIAEIHKRAAQHQNAPKSKLHKTKGVKATLRTVGPRRWAAGRPATASGIVSARSGPASPAASLAAGR